jgi:phosphoribosyl 1,2-cyclic phosphodiesterase
VGWGHSALSHVVAFAALARVQRLVTFHHDPTHDDRTLDRLLEEARRSRPLSFEVLPGTEGGRFDLDAG